MAYANNRGRICPHCKGKYIIGEVEGKRFWGIFKQPNTIIFCDKCDFGWQEPKQVILKADSYKEEITY